MDIYRRKPDVDWLAYRHHRPHVATASPYTFAHARTGLKYGLRALALPAGMAVLCPDYLCHSLESVFAQAGLQLVYYPVLPDLTPNWAGLLQVATPATCALLMVHYFGQPQAVPRFQALCRERGWALIDDNAHGHGGRFAGQWLGACGDMGVASPGKLFGIRDSGLLYLRDGLRVEIPQLPVQPVDARWRWLRGQLRRARDGFPGAHRWLTRCPPYDSQDAFRDGPVPEWAMDEVSAAMLARVDIEAARAMRHRLHTIWAGFATRHGLAPVFAQLASDAMPLVYAARSAGATETARWCRWGHRVGIDVHTWPTLPACVLQADGLAVRLWERTVCFPIHQAMSPERLAARLGQSERDGPEPAD